MKSFFFIVGLLLPFTLAAPVESEELIRTPVGLRPKSSVIAVPHGGSIKHVGNEIHLLDASNKVVHVAPHDRNAKARTNTSDIVPQQSGWIAYASWFNNGSPINSFTTTWPVPPAPATDNGQTVFLFNSIEPASFNAILQPVLQYGPSAAGGGSFWAVSNWYVGSTTTYFSPLANVNAGQVLEGIIELTAQSGSSFSYVSKFSDVGSSITLDNSDELVWATETLEAYGITTGSDYPKGSTPFSGINLKTTSGTPSMSWSVSNDAADGVFATVATDGATNGVVVINYETS